MHQVAGDRCVHLSQFTNRDFTMHTELSRHNPGRRGNRDRGLWNPELKAESQKPAEKAQASMLSYVI
jgi:hypothetical protein